MSLSIGVLVGAGCALYGGVKIVKESKKKKETPWTFYAERLEKKRRKRRGGSRTAPTLAVVARGQAAIKKLTEEPFICFSDDSRQQQLVEISQDTNEGQISELEKQMNRYFAFSVASLGLTTAGLFYPLLNLVSLPVLIYPSTYFFIRAPSLIKEGRVAIALVDTISMAGTLITGHFLAASLMCALYFLSRKLLIKTEDHSSKKLITLFGEQPRFVWIQNDEVEVEIPFEELKSGDTVIVHAGETIPVDGIISEGYANVNQRMLTGESQPVEKGPSQQVLAGTVVLAGTIYIKAEKAGQESVAGQIGEILSDMTDFKTSVQSRGEKMADKGAPPTLAFSALALPLLGPSSAVAALCAYFGCHMRLVAPITVVNFLRIASDNGILVKDGRALELLSEVDTIVFDKTGTLTQEVPTVAKVYSNGYLENERLTYAAAAEYKQTHPIALAIQQEAVRRGLNPPPINDAKYEVGYGLKVKVEEQLIRVGSERFMEMEGIAIPSNIKKKQEDGHEKGYSLVYIAIDNQLGGAIELRPTIRPEVKRIISQLTKRQKSLYIISGDHEKPTKKLAEELGIDHYFAQVLPQNKATLIEELQKEGKSVCFIGDGINDSIALKKANVSISLRGASTAATDTASIILMDGSLKELVALLDIAQNLDANLKTTTIMTVIPGVVCIGGVFFLHFGIVSAVMLFNIGLVASILNAMWPLIMHEKENHKK